MSEVDISRAAFWGSRTSKTRSVSSCLRLRIGLSDVCRDETDLTFALADDVYVDEDEDEDDDDDDDLTCLSAFRGFFFARGLIANGLDILDLTTGGSTVSELDLSSSSSLFLHHRRRCCRRRRHHYRRPRRPRHHHRRRWNPPHSGDRLSLSLLLRLAAMLAVIVIV